MYLKPAQKKKTQVRVSREGPEANSVEGRTPEKGHLPKLMKKRMQQKKVPGGDW